MAQVALLSRQPELYSTRRLQQALAECGLQVVRLAPEEFILDLDGGFAWRHRGAEGAEVAAVLPRVGSPLTQLGARILRHFAAQGAYCLNGADALLAARDKFGSLQILRGAGLPVPRTAYFAHPSQRDMLLDALPPPVVIKLLSGSQGVGVNLAESREAASALLDTLLHLKHEAMVQEYLPGRSDLRIIVLGGKVLAAMERQASTRDFRSNLHCGGQARAWDLEALDETAQELARRASAALGLELAGVDLMRAEDGSLRVLEVNPVPSLEGIETATGVDIAAAIASWLRLRVEERGRAA
ncbi:MAG: ATP-grasp domain-containing protein [Acidithiobacillus sp.]